MQSFPRGGRQYISPQLVLFLHEILAMDTHELAFKSA